MTTQELELSDIFPIKSFLSQDLYQLTMAQIVYNNFANISVEYDFTCRNAEQAKIFEFVGRQDLEDMMDNLEKLSLSEDEYQYLKAQGYFEEGFLDWLRLFRFEPRRHLIITTKNGKWSLSAKGSWLHTIFYEIFCLQFINQRFARNYTAKIQNGDEAALRIGEERLNAKIIKMQVYNQECRDKGLPVPKIVEFGTRRRFARLWQDHVIATLQNRLPENLVGTSNVEYAYKYGIAPVGTFSHQFPMALQGIYPVQHSQRQAFKLWLTEYRGLWGSALTDTLGDEKFFKDFTFELAKGFDGVRHDSGDPFAYGERIIKMYEGYGIDPKTKRLMFSDGLDFDMVIALHKHFVGRIQVGFGVGTNLTNDLNIPTLHIVMKIVKSNNQDVAKLSANPAKASCRNKQYLDYVKMAIEQY